MKDMLRRKASPRMRRFARGLVAVRRRYDRTGSNNLARQVARLRKRVVELEAEVQENRRLNRRIAELTDVVQDLLVAGDGRDEADLRKRLGEPGRRKS